VTSQPRAVAPLALTRGDRTGRLQAKGEVQTAGVQEAGVQSGWVQSGWVQSGWGHSGWGPGGEVRTGRDQTGRVQWHRRERGSDGRDQTGGPRWGPGAVPVAAGPIGRAWIGARPPRGEVRCGPGRCGAPRPWRSASRRIVEAPPVMQGQSPCRGPAREPWEDRSWAELRVAGRGARLCGGCGAPRATANAGRHGKRTWPGRGPASESGVTASVLWAAMARRAGRRAGAVGRRGPCRAGVGSVPGVGQVGGGVRRRCRAGPWWSGPVVRVMVGWRAASARATVVAWAMAASVAAKGVSVVWPLS
jgi:hypothetical protein